MITLKELCKGYQFESLPGNHKSNLEVLLERINRIRQAWGKPMSVTSGYRSKEHHIRIYKELAAKRGQVFDIAKVPMGSKHLIGAACDIYDSDGKLYEWCQANQKLLEEVGLWCEIKDDQPRVHFQVGPPASGARFFHP